MLDPKRVRTQTEEIARRLAIKGYTFDKATFDPVSYTHLTLPTN